MTTRQTVEIARIERAYGRARLVPFYTPAYYRIADGLKAGTAVVHTGESLGAGPVFLILPSGQTAVAATR